MRRLDQGILLTLFLLLGVGLVQVYSSSFIFATESRGDGLFFFKRQLVFTLLGLAVLLLTANVPWRWFERGALAVWLFVSGLLFLTYAPGFGVVAGGARRWLHLPGGLVMEPSEWLKVTFPFAVAALLSTDRSRLTFWKLGLWLIVLLAPLAAVLKQPDFGSFAICLTVLGALFFVFGLRMRYLIGASIVGLPCAYYLLMSQDYRRSRMLSFLDPWQDASQKGFQVIQSMLGFHSGGFSGVGLGQGQAKLFFLPESHTDFTLAVLGEETGFLGVLAVMLLFGYLLFRAFQIAFQAEQRFAKAVALGLAVVLSLAVVINSGVALGLLPTKGLTLPFLSYGGSSLVASCFAVGVLLNIDKLNQGFAKASQATKNWRHSRVKIKGGGET